MVLLLKGLQSSRETALFETFEGYLRNDQKGVGRIRSSRQKSPKGSQETNPYYDIREEMNLLREIKDICDELNILKNLYEDQELVWKQAFKMPLGDQEGLASEVYPPTELRWELEELIAEAVEVQRAINTLLDLKQQQSNIAEAV